MTQVKVGIFVAAGLAVLLVTIFTLGSNKSLFQEVFHVHSYFDSVQGLNKGAVVSLSGVKVGNVDDVTYDDQRNLVKVLMLIDADYQHKIRKDSRIEIRTQGALGDKFLYITPGTAQSELLRSGDEIAADYGNDIISVFSKRGSESEKIFDILNDVKVMTGSLSENRRIDKITANLEKVTANLADLTEQMNKTVKGGSLDRSVGKLEKIIDKVDRGEGTLGALINDNTLHERLKTILGAGQKEQQIRSILKSSVEE